MSQALFTSMGGINVAQQAINVVSNNVANINTTAFKAADARFSTLFSNTLTTGNSPSASAGGTNPKQIGLGVQLASITRNFEPGTYLSTGNGKDLMISGRGYFTVMDPAGKIYMTRDGSFTLDADGNMTSANGYKVLGADALFSEESSSTPIKIPQEFTTEIKGDTALNTKLLKDLNNGKFTEGKLTFNIVDETTTPATTHPCSIDITAADLADGVTAANFATTLTTKINAAITAAGMPTATATVGFGAGNNAGKMSIAMNGATLQFTPDSTSNIAETLQIDTVKTGTSSLSKTLNYTVGVNPATSVTNTVSLKAYSVGEDGAIEATYSNGDKMSSVLNKVTNKFEFKYITSTGVVIRGGDVAVNPRVATPSGMVIQMATVTNEAGLAALPNNMWQSGPNAGSVRFTVGNQMGLGAVTAGGLEGSNVDLSRELSNMIIAQRAIQANSRVFSTASSVLEALSTLGR